MADTQDNGELGFDIVAALGSDAGVSVQRFAVYVPNKTKKGEEFGTQRKWVLGSDRTAGGTERRSDGHAARGGCWMGDDNKIVWEHPIVVYSFIRPKEFIANLPRVREFLHRMGRETDQGEVAFEFGSDFFRIRTFDEK
jgi:hypothetical protein